VDRVEPVREAATASATLVIELNIQALLPRSFDRFESQLTLQKISSETQHYPHSLRVSAATNCSFMPQPGRAYGTERI
jgi:hypothetical protein